MLPSVMSYRIGIIKMVRSVSSNRVSSAINFQYVLRSCIWVLEVSILFLYTISLLDFELFRHCGIFCYSFYFFS